MSDEQPSVGFIQHVHPCEPEKRCVGLKAIGAPADTIITCLGCGQKGQRRRPGPVKIADITCKACALAVRDLPDKEEKPDGTFVVLPRPAYTIYVTFDADNNPLEKTQ